MEFLQNVCLAHLQLQMDTSAKYQANWTETVGGVVRTSILNVNQRQYHQFFIEFSRKLRLAHLQLLMNTSAKFKVNLTQTVGGVVRTSIFKSNQGQ